jgi:anaerobic selenocysteine-containing dehydrogenase
VASPPQEDAEQRMLGAAPGVPALGRGPATEGDHSRHEYDHPAAGWGAARSVRKVLERAGEPLEGFRALFVMNHEDGGFDCPGCAWPDDPNGLHLDICENGVKHVTWELAPAKADREFFAAHTVGELAGWSDHDLEAVGRLAEPLSYDSASDRYVPISWEDAFALVGNTLRGLESPDQAAFYTSGRLSNEATFLYQLWVREFGTNADDYDRIRDTMAKVLHGFEDFNARARDPHGFRIDQPARERVFQTPSGRAEFSLAPLPDDVDPGKSRLTLTTVRSHDQFNTTIYSNDDRYRGLKGLRTVVFMNEDDMRDRGLDQFDLVDVTSFSKDGTERTVYGYRAVRYEIAPGCAAGYMPELNVLCGIADFSTQSEQPVTKHLVVEVRPSRER